MTNNTVRSRSFRCNDNVWTKFKVICTKNGESMQDKVASLIADYVNDTHKLNDGTETKRNIR
jgi:hypothetical protein